MRAHTVAPPRGGCAGGVASTPRARPVAASASTAFTCRRRAAPAVAAAVPSLARDMHVHSDSLALARTALTPLPPRPAAHRRRPHPRSSLAARAMVNVDFSPALVLGMGLIGGGLTLYQLRRFRPGLSRDFDVIVSSVAIFSGGILVFQGWRLDPLLLFCQLLTAGMALAFAVETLRLREEVAEEETPVMDARSRFADPPPPPGGEGRAGRGIPLPDPGPGGEYFGTPWVGGGADPYYREAPPSPSAYGSEYGNEGYYSGGAAPSGADFYEWPGGSGYDGAGYAPGDDGGAADGAGYASGGEDAWRPTAGVGGGSWRRGGGGSGPRGDDVEDWD